MRRSPPTARRLFARRSLIVEKQPLSSSVPHCDFRRAADHGLRTSCFRSIICHRAGPSRSDRCSGSLAQHTYNGMFLAVEDEFESAQSARAHATGRPRLFSSVVVPRRSGVSGRLASLIEFACRRYEGLTGNQPGAGALMGKKKWRKMALFSRPRNRHFSFLKWRILNISLWLGRFYVSELFWRPRAQKMAAAIFGPGLFSTSRPVAVAAQTLRIWTCRRHDRYRPRPDGDLPVARRVLLLRCERICWLASA